MFIQYLFDKYIEYFIFYCNFNVQDELLGSSTQSSIVSYNLQSEYIISSLTGYNLIKIANI